MLPLLAELDRFNAKFERPASRHEEPRNSSQIITFVSMFEYIHCVRA
jgi:hypothetical protein